MKWISPVQVITTSKKNDGTAELTISLQKDIPVTGDILVYKHAGSLMTAPVLKASKKRFSKDYVLTVNTWHDYNEQEEVIPLQKGGVALIIDAPDRFHGLPFAEKKEIITRVLHLAGAPQSVSGFIKKQVQPALCMKPVTTVPIREYYSKFGGLPYAREGFGFPKDAHGKSALFICQISMREIRSCYSEFRHIPYDGIFYFFGTIKEESGFEYFGDMICRYEEHPQQPVHIPLPEDILPYGIFQESEVMIGENITIPPEETSLWPGTLSPEESNAYDQARTLLGTYDLKECAKLFGHPNQVQGCLLYEAVLKKNGRGWYDPTFDPSGWQELYQELCPETDHWQLLFELDMMIPDHYLEKLSSGRSFNTGADGIHYLMIEKKAFAAGRFDEAISLYQST
jgi:hypothetical protein